MSRCLDVRARTVTIDPQDWDRFLELVQRGKFRAGAHRRMIANALAHVKRSDLRAAIVEAVAAWEMVLHQNAPAVCAQKQIAYDVEDWKSLIDKAGLRAGTKLFLAFAPSVGSEEDRAALLACIQDRNTVVHQGQHRFEPSTVRARVASVRNMVLSCEEQVVTMTDP